MSNHTKKYRNLMCIFSITSFVITIAPLLFYIIAGYIESDLTREKVTLTCMVLCAIILVTINILFKYNIRSTIWLLLLGVYVCIDNILPLLLTIALGTIADEFIVSPLKKMYKEKYTINKEIDKRIEE